MKLRCRFKVKVKVKLEGKFNVEVKVKLSVKLKVTVPAVNSVFFQLGCVQLGSVPTRRRSIIFNLVSLERGL